MADDGRYRTAASRPQLAGCARYCPSNRCLRIHLCSFISNCAFSHPGWLVGCYLCATANCCVRLAALFGAVRDVVQDCGLARPILPMQQVALVHSVLEASRNIRAQGATVLPHYDLFDIAAILSFQRFQSDSGAVVQLVGNAFLDGDNDSFLRIRRIRFEGGSYEMLSGYLVEADFEAINACRLAVSTMLLPNLPATADVITSNLAAFEGFCSLTQRLAKRKTQPQESLGQEVMLSLRFHDNNRAIYLPPFPCWTPGG